MTIREARARLNETHFDELQDKELTFDYYTPIREINDLGAVKTTIPHELKDFLFYILLFAAGICIGAHAWWSLVVVIAVHQVLVWSMLRSFRRSNAEA